MYADLNERKLHNDNINKVPKILKNIIGNKVVVKLFQYTEAPTTASGVLDPEFIERFSEEGQKASKLNLDVVRWSPKGVVVHVPEGAKQIVEDFHKTTLSPGDIVHVDPKAVTMGSGVFYKVDNPARYFDFEGIIKITPASIDIKTDEHVELEYTD